MIDQNQEAFRLNQQFLATEPNSVIKLNIPKNNQQQILKTIEDSNRLLKSIQTKQVLAEKNGSIYYKNLAKQRISPFELTSEDNLQVSKKQVLEMSIYPLLGKIVLQHFQNLLKMETQINPITKQLVKTPKDKFVVQFVTDFVAIRTLQQKFDMIDDQFDNQFDSDARIALWQPLVRFTFNSLKKLNFIVSPQLFQQILWNNFISQPLTEDKVQIERQIILRKRLEQIYTENFDKKNAYEDKVTQLMISSVLKKRENLNKPDPKFFQVVTQPNNFDTTIYNGIEAQANSLIRMSQAVKDSIEQQNKRKQQLLDRQKKIAAYYEAQQSKIV